MRWIVIVGEGVIGVCVQFAALIMHRLFGLNLVWQWSAGWEPGEFTAKILENNVRENIG